MDFNQLKKTLGPGILFASTAIGVSHLVQSTRAGSGYGLSLIWLVLLANVLKYPFFEFATRYANVKGESILHGYKKLGKWPLILYVLVSLMSMFTVTAAVSFVCSGLLGNLLGSTVSLEWMALFIFFIGGLLLLKGNFGTLDGVIKIIAIVLLITILFAFVLSILHGPIVPMEKWNTPSIWTDNGWIFLIALLGWMPTAVDMSAWSSIWTIERIKQTGFHPSLKASLFDFNLGYWISALLSICFIVLGAYFMHGTGMHFSDSSVLFAGELINLFTVSIGDWSYWIISIAAFSVMLSTTITVFDGYARSMSEATNLLTWPKWSSNYKFWLLVVLVGGFIIILFFVGQLRALVNVATISSFLIAPLIAVLNYRLVFSVNFPDQQKPNKILQILSLIGIIFLISFSVLFLWKML